MAVTGTLNEGKGLVPFSINASSTGVVKVKGIKVLPIGTLDDFLKTYVTVKQVQTLVDFKSKYIVKDGYFISSLDNDNKKVVEQFFRSIPIEELISMWAKNSMIYGNGYLEFTGDNLVPRDSRKLFPYIDEEGRGQIVNFVQEVGNDPTKYPIFEVNEILMLKNNPIDHIRGMSEFLAYDEIIQLDDSVMRDISVTLNRQAYPRKQFKIGTEANKIAIESPKFAAAQDLISNLLPGQDIVTNYEIEVVDASGKSAGADYKDYVNMINERICMEMNIPSDIWFGNNSGDTIKIRKQVFEETEIMVRRRQIEEIINRELIPQLITVNEEEPVYFRFGDINTEMSFIKAKIDLTKLQTGAITPDEIRVTEGLDPIGASTTGVSVPGQAQQVPISSRDETSQSSIGGNLSGARPAQ